MDIIMDWTYALSICDEMIAKYPKDHQKRKDAEGYVRLYNNIHARNLALYNKMLSLEEIKPYVERLPE